MKRLLPDHVKRKKTADDDGSATSARTSSRTSESVALAEFSLDHADKVMAAIPPELSRSSRRHVAQTMHRVLSLAVSPREEDHRKPLPRGFLPAL